MVPDLSETTRIYMFIKGPIEPLRGLVGSSRPTTLQDAVGRARDLQVALPRARAPLPPRQGFQEKGRDTKAPPPRPNEGCGQLDKETQRDL